jgi:hypothetical protein
VDGFYSSGTQTHVGTTERIAADRGERSRIAPDVRGRCGLMPPLSRESIASGEPVLDVLEGTYEWLLSSHGIRCCRRKSNCGDGRAAGTRLPLAAAPPEESGTEAGWCSLRPRSWLLRSFLGHPLPLSDVRQVCAPLGGLPPFWVLRRHLGPHPGVVAPGAGLRSRRIDRSNSLTGTTAPPDAPSGEHLRHRPCRAGNRRMNHVLHVAAIVHLRHDSSPHGSYFAR